MAIFAPLVAWRHGIVWPGWRTLAGYAAISTSLVAFFWCMFYSLRTTSALNTGAISTLIPGLTAIAGAILVGERLGWHRLAALGIGLIGALWVVFRGDWDRFVALDLNEGDLIYFAGCVAMGFYSRWSSSSTGRAGVGHDLLDRDHQRCAVPAHRERSAVDHGVDGCTALRLRRGSSSSRSVRR